MLLLEVHRHEVRLNGSSKSHCPDGVASFEYSLFIKVGNGLDNELTDEFLLQSKTGSSSLFVGKFAHALFVDIRLCFL